MNHHREKLIQKLEALVTSSTERLKDPDLPQHVRNAREHQRDSYQQSLNTLRGLTKVVEWFPPFIKCDPQIRMEDYRQIVEMEMELFKSKTPCSIKTKDQYDKCQNYLDLLDTLKKVPEEHPYE